MAAVHVTADLLPDKARGLPDVMVSASGGRDSLKNGILISTVLVGPRAAPGAAKPVLASPGPVLVGGGRPHLTVGPVVNGAMVLNPNPGRLRS